MSGMFMRLVARKWIKEHYQYILKLIKNGVAVIYMVTDNNYLMKTKLHVY